MGQYYKPIILNEDKKPIAYAYSHSFGSGLKLMEHSWMKNDFVGFIERILFNTSNRIVWAGDYADEDIKLTEDQIKEIFNENKEFYKTPEEQEAFILKIREEGINMYDYASRFAHEISHGQEVKDKYNHNFDFADPKKCKYLINYDKKEFVDKKKTPLDNDGWQIHPLPLLTCEGNGRGGGDFRGDDPRGMIGRWSRDKIGVVSRKADIPKGFREIGFNLSE
jgi:hypothetical protein